MFFISNYRFYCTDRLPERKGRTAVVVLPPLASIDATEVCIPSGNSEVLLATVCKSSGHVWAGTDVTEFLSFRHKSLLAGDLNS
jgi:hypothetical protein